MYRLSHELSDLLPKDLKPLDIQSGEIWTQEFQSIIYSSYKKEGRAFPWREDLRPWGILVSEFMLQQTQTERVVPYWERWIKKWPTPKALSKAPLEEVLREWSGLGYNRRAKNLKECAEIITRDWKGKVPEKPEDLVKLPGIGPYTAGAIACFAYNYPAVFIETNIRSVMLHFFFVEMDGVKDDEIMPLLEAALDRENPAMWYWALMDYGVLLKKSNANPSRRSAHYSRQGAFSGSLRQIRGGIIKALASDGSMTSKELQSRMPVKTDEKDFYKALEALRKESMVAEKEGKYGIKI